MSPSVSNYQLSVPAIMAFSCSIRKVSSEVFSYLGFTDPELFRLILVIDELYMNAVQHGSQEGSSVHLTFEYEKGYAVTVYIDDEGSGEKCSIKDIKDRMAIEFQRHDAKKTSGRGLAQIALNLADDLRFEKNQYGGIRVIFVKSLPSQE